MNLDTSVKNVGKTDRMIRFAVGILLLLISFRNSNLATAIIGLVLVATAYVRFCPTYSALKFSSNTDEKPVGK